MTEWDAMGGIDGPRPLRPELRDRLEQALRAGTGDEELPLGEDLSTRLEDVLTDPVAAALAGIDGPRPLTDATRARLEQTLRTRVAMPRWIAAAAAALLVAGGVSAGLVASSGGSPATSQARRALHSGTPTNAGSANGGSVSFGAQVARGSAANGGQAAPAMPVIVASPTGGGPGPEVSGIDPASGPASGGTWVTVTGSRFEGATAVTFGGRSAVAFTVVSAGRIRAEAPPHEAGTVDVQVLGPSGTSSAGAPDRFTYLVG